MKLYSKGSTGLIFFFLFFGSILLLPQLVDQEEPIPEVAFTQFLNDIELPKDDPSQIVEVQIQEGSILGTRQDKSQFKTYGPLSPATQDLLNKKNITINYLPPEKPGFLMQMAFFLLPIVVIGLFFVWFLNRSGNKMNNTLNFGKNKAKLLDKNTGVTFNDVAGVDESKEELEEVVEFLKNPKKFTKLGGKIPKGILMVGSPGSGKTLLAKAVAGEAGVPFLTISGSDFVEMFVGVGASRVRNLFETAKKHAPCIVFIDEIDAVGRHRGAGMGGGHDEREQTLNQLLVEMDGFEENKGVIIIAATNRVDVLDPALLRPGRFDRQVQVPNPDSKGRSEILKIHSKAVPLAQGVNLEVIAKGTPGFSGADLANLVNEAALIAARNDHETITNNHFELARDKIIMGPARKSMIMPEKERETTAYHEIGHALVGWFTEAADPIHKVTIVPRGRALGVTMMLPDQDRLSYSKKQALAMIDYAMGGRAAEELVFGHYTTGASDDIKKATDLAKKIVCEWGMSSLGPVNLSALKGGDPFLGRDYGKQVTHSEDLAKRIDKAIMDIINRSYDRAKAILIEKEDLLIKISKDLLDKETLLHEDIKNLIEESVEETP